MKASNGIKFTCNKNSLVLVVFLRK